MRKLVLLTAAVALMSATALAAAPGKIAIGWVNPDAPIGVRIQFAEKIAGDIGLGFWSDDDGDGKNGRTYVRVHTGLPITLLSGDRASLAFRPGLTFNYTSFEAENADATMDFYLHAWLAVYYAVTDNFGVTAAHGIDIAVNDGGEADNTIDIYSSARDVFNAGWYYWF